MLSTRLHMLPNAMHLIELFLPLRDGSGSAFPKDMFDAVRDELAEVFGGVTAFIRTPATGLWEDEGGAMKWCCLK